ncbi:MAG: urea amidolyase associated protein UAAP1 [Panacagrimonas sp.]
MSAETAARTAASIAANRQRYLELKSAGQQPARPLPPNSPRELAIDAARVLRRESIPGGWYASYALKRGQALRLLNPQATPGVSLFAWNADEPSERLNVGDTVKVQWSAELRKGRLLLSDMGRVLLSMIEDSCGAHDALLGGSTPASNAQKYGDASLRNTRENFVLAAAKLGLGRRDVGPCVTFFAPVAADGQGRFHWRENCITRGDFVDLRAEMNLLVAVSNCPHPLAPGVHAPDEIEVTLWNAPPPAPDDDCRTSSVEALRAFENTDACFVGVLA